ncbi:hypothetical protein [Sporosarcina sp. YIM B06819]|nr:hypothetical protein [Sporosarcina sp. YIM B06819]
MAVTLWIWVIVVILGLSIGTFLLYKIEKSGVERWGASGKLFK